MTLGEILAGVRLQAATLAGCFPNWTSQGLDYDSRRVQPGYLFFAFPGSRADGRAVRAAMRWSAAPWRWPANPPRPEEFRRALD